MAFSESLGIGNTTFLNLLGEPRCAQEIEAGGGLEVVHESPTALTEDQKSSFSRTRSRLGTNVSRPSDERHRHFRRSKSDSTLPQSKTVATAQKHESCHSNNYSVFFQNDFTFSDEANVEKEQSQLRVSHIEAALNTNKTEVKNGLFDLDMPIRSEDFRELLQSQDTKKIVGDNHQGIKATSEETPQLDSSSFMCPILGTEGAKYLFAELQHSRQAVSALKKVPIKESLCDISLSCMSPDQLRWSTTTPTESLTQLKEATNESDIERKNQPTISLKGQDAIENIDFEALKRISAWNLPHSVLQEYEKKGVNKMFDWQIECLSNPKVLFEHRNLVYSAPTSAGKTLVSEILLLKTVLERSKKVLLILPFISVVREKMFYLQDLLTTAGYRVEGFFGGYTPPGGFDSIHVAICTIEKANSIVNKLLEQGKLDEIGAVVVDEVHLISDPGRGYILELLLAKVLYMSRKYALQIQVITMSATLANVELLKHWLDAELFITDFRPVALQEMIKIGNKIYDTQLRLLRDVTQPPAGEKDAFPALANDADHVAQLCMETLLEGCSVVVFCPSKDWCENLAVQLASAIHALGKSGSPWGIRLRAQLNRAAIDEVKRQLSDIPTGIDAVLGKTITFGCAYHHAGLTTEERDIVEASFKSGALKIIVATSTLSSGVNLPARRVLIRSPLFGGKQMSSLTYRQMIGRAGRMGKDTRGESILICSESNARTGRDLIQADLNPISSCLEMDNSTHLKRALLEVISSGVAGTKDDIESFVSCTLLSAQKQLSEQEKDNSTPQDQFITEALKFLVEYEFVRLQTNEETREQNYVATRLGMACLASSMPPADGLILFAELQTSRRCFVLESELHAVYLVTPYSVCYQLQNLDWLLFLDLWERLTPAMKKVAELVGVKESFMVRAMRGQTKLDYKLMQIHKRFYTALALQELVNETPINDVAAKFKCTRGMLQSLQQMSATFAGIVTAFCNSLQWATLSLIVSEFKERLFFGIHRDLIDLMRLPDVNQKRARALFDAGIPSVVELASVDVLKLEKVLHDSLSFDLVKQGDNEDAHDAQKRTKQRNFFITGKAGLTIAEAAKLLVAVARQFVQYDIGVGNINWTQESSGAKGGESRPDDMHMSTEEIKVTDALSSKKRKSLEQVAKLSKIRRSNDGSEPAQLNTVTMKKNAKRKELKPTDRKNEELDRTIKESDMRDIKTNETSNSNPNINVEGEHKTNVEKRQSEIDLKHETQKQHFGKNMKDIGNNNNIETNIKKLPRESKNNAKSENKLLSNEKVKTASGIMPDKQSSLQENKATSNALTNKANLRVRGKQPAVVLMESTVATQKNQNFDSNRRQSSVILVKKKNSPMQPPTRSNTSKDQVPRTAPSRRSPRNRSLKTTPVSAQATKVYLNKTPSLDELFMDDNDSFDALNSGLTDALEAAEKLHTVQTLVAQRHEPVAKSPALNYSDDDIPSSQQLQDPISPMPTSYSSTQHSSRFLRSFRTHQRTMSAKTTQSHRREKPQDPASAVAVVPDDAASCSSELSSMSMDDNSILKNPIQLNASHILSCSKEESDASSCFKSIEIVDICGNRELFESAFAELKAAKRFGFSLGLERQASGQRKALIGGNLLINQVAAAEHQRATVAHAQSMPFQVNDGRFLAGIAFSICDHVSFYMNMQSDGSFSGCTPALKGQYLRALLEDGPVTLLSVDAKDQLKILRMALPALSNYGESVGLEDPKVANWLLQPDKVLTYKEMTQQFAPECTALVNLCGNRRGYGSFGLDASSAILGKIRCSIEACVNVHILKGQLENLQRIGTAQLYKFYTELEMPLQRSLCNMELIGFPVSESALRKLYQQMVDTMKRLEMKIYKMHGSRFNLGAAAAVAKVLGLHRKVNGRFSTSRQILEKVDTPIAQLIIAYRKLSVTLSKNIQPLLQCVQRDRIHSQSITYTATGRISMAEPNLQNVAKDFDVTLDGESIQISCRGAFLPSDKQRCLISSDFCQLEMRILAHLSQDAGLLEVMNSQKDLFVAIAARWNKISDNSVTEQLRNGTKQICYGIVYGMGMRSLSEALKCSEQEAVLVSNQFHATYPGIKTYAEKVVKFARQNGYIETITGRRRYLEHINSCEPLMKSQAERQAINSTIQGSAADIAKNAVLRMEKNIVKYRDKLGITNEQAVRLVLHLHDELIFEVPVDKAKKVAKVLRVTMETCVKLSVPLKVKLKIGSSWADLKEVKL